MQILASILNLRLAQQLQDEKQMELVA